MEYTVSLEQVGAQWLANVPALLGCFAGRPTREAALAALPEAARSYAAWRQSKGDASFALDEPLAFTIEEIMCEWPDPAHPDYTVSPFFAADAPVLTANDIAIAARLLDWANADLLAAAQVAPETLTQRIEGSWSIARVLRHCANAEWWYVARLGLAPTVEKPADWRERLSLAHQQLLAVLPTLEGVARIELHDAELWSPRKLVRRALWHERDHTQHIYRFRGQLGV